MPAQEQKSKTIPGADLARFLERFLDPANHHAASSYLAYLPAIYQEEAFLGRFLLAFEAIFTELEETIQYSHNYLKPEAMGGVSGRAPDEFLPWLAGWVALTLHEEWDDETRRRFIRAMVPLYRQRGTKSGLQKILETYLDDPEAVVIYDSRARAGRPGFLYDPPAHFFQVQVKINEKDPERVWRMQRTIRTMIDQAKPAHTFYAIQFLLPAMRLASPQMAEQVGEEQLVLGKNTLMGSVTE